VFPGDREEIKVNARAGWRSDLAEDRTQSNQRGYLGGMRLLGKSEYSEWKLRNKQTDRLVEIGDPACQMTVDIGWTTEGIDRKKMESPVPRAHGYPPAICRKTDIMDDAGSPASP